MNRIKLMRFLNIKGLKNLKMGITGYQYEGCWVASDVNGNRLLFWGKLYQWCGAGYMGVGFRIKYLIVD